MLTSINHQLPIYHDIVNPAAIFEGIFHCRTVIQCRIIEDGNVGKSTGAQ